MCGRFFRHKVSWEEYYAQLNLFRPEDIPEFVDAYNIAPTQTAPIIRRRHDEGTLEIVPAIWGLVPVWWKKPLSEKKFSTFNAKAEEAHTKPTFRSAFKSKPCLVPMSGFYEWTGPKGRKKPFAISMQNRRWFCVAGLWDRVYVDDQPLDSFTILTTAPNEFMSELHNRMPLIPEQSEARDWILSDLDARKDMIKPYCGCDLHAWEVGKAVGNVRNQGKSLISQA
jgi:putative SOS response-associated peptidase YedK